MITGISISFSGHKSVNQESLSIINDSEVGPSSYNVVTEELPQTNSHTCHELHPSSVRVPAKKMFDLDVDCIEDKDEYEMSEAGTHGYNYPFLFNQKYSHLLGFVTSVFQMA